MSVPSYLEVDHDVDYVFDRVLGDLLHPPKETQYVQTHQSIESLPLIGVARSWRISVVYGIAKGSGLWGTYCPCRHNKPPIITLWILNLHIWFHELVHAADDRLNQIRTKTIWGELTAELATVTLLRCFLYLNDLNLGTVSLWIKHYAKILNLDPIDACQLIKSRVCGCSRLILDEYKGEQ